MSDCKRIVESDGPYHRTEDGRWFGPGPATVNGQPMNGWVHWIADGVICQVKPGLRVSFAAGGEQCR